MKSLKKNSSFIGGVNSENLSHCPQAPVLWSRMASGYAEHGQHGRSGSTYHG